METTLIQSVKRLPPHMRIAAKSALAVGAETCVSADGEQLKVKFDHGDLYYFDPEHVTLHALELLGHARNFGFVTPVVDGLEVATVSYVRQLLVVRTVFSTGDVRAQIGASKWFVDTHPNTAIALRRAVCNAFSSYYDEIIAPYAEA